MKKIVINKCYGGFSLSPLALKRWAELQGKMCYFFRRDFNGSNIRHFSITLKEAQKQSLFISAFTISNPDEYLSKDKEWYEMTRVEKVEDSKKFDEVYLSFTEIDRDNTFLIQVVEELGSEKASGRFSKLKIVEIPTGIDWEIEEYDGMETVGEKHRSWS